MHERKHNTGLEIAQRVFNLVKEIDELEERKHTKLNIMEC